MLTANMRCLIPSVTVPLQCGYVSGVRIQYLERRGGLHGGGGGGGEEKGERSKQERVELEVSK